MDHSYRVENDSTQGRRTLILCFDGTGNKFQGNGGDSNIIKIFSMLDRRNKDVQAYYQPGMSPASRLSVLNHIQDII